MSKLSVFTLLLVLIYGTFAMYSSSSPVIQLTAKDFDKVYKGVWLVQFYAPWCGHCQRLTPQYEKAAKALKGLAKIAAINADSQKTSVAIQGYPTIKFFVDGKMTDYNGERTSKGIIEFILTQYRKIAYNRIGQKASSGGNSQSGGHSSEGSADEKDVIILTDDNFEQNVYKDNSPWFIEFYAPWCGHCQRLAPQWAALATTLKGEVKVAKVDATQNKQIAGRFGVNGYPTIKFFPGGSKDDSSAVDYDGPRSEGGMADWLRQKTAASGHFEHIELTSQDVFDKHCKDKSLCIISFLPHKLDCTPQERAAYLDTIKQVALKFKGKPFKFIWAQGGDHIEAEQKLNVAGIGYPSVAAVFHAKGLTGKLKRSFSQQNLQHFMTQILGNKAKFSKLVGSPSFKKVQSTAEYGAGSQEGNCGESQCTQPHEEEPEEL